MDNISLGGKVYQFFSPLHCEFDNDYASVSFLRFCDFAITEFSMDFSASADLRVYSLVTLIYINQCFLHRRNNMYT